MVIALVITVFNMMTMLHLPVCPQQKHLNTAANSLRASSLVGGGGGGVWGRGEESLHRRLRNLNICIEKVDAKC